MRLLMLVLSLVFSVGGCAPSKDAEVLEAERVARLKDSRKQISLGFLEQIKWVDAHSEQRSEPDVNRVLLSASDLGVSEPRSDGLDFIQSFEVPDRTYPYLVIPSVLTDSGGRTLKRLVFGQKEAHLTGDGTHWYISLFELAGDELFDLTEAEVQEWKLGFSVSANDSGDPSLEEEMTLRMRIRGPNPISTVSAYALQPYQVGKTMVNWGSGGFVELAQETIENLSDRALIVWIRFPENGASLHTVIQSNYYEVLPSGGNDLAAVFYSYTPHQKNWLYRGEIRLSEIEVTILGQKGQRTRLKIPESSLKAGFVAVPIEAHQRLRVGYLSQALSGQSCPSTHWYTQEKDYSPWSGRYPNRTYQHRDQFVLAMDSVGTFKRIGAVTEASASQNSGSIQAKSWKIAPWSIPYSNVAALGRLQGTAVPCVGFPRAIDSI
jgi:hypothetical protein